MNHLWLECVAQHRVFKAPRKARFMGPTWGPSGADRTQVGPTLAPWTLVSGTAKRTIHITANAYIAYIASFDTVRYWNRLIIIFNLRLSYTVKCVRSTQMTLFRFFGALGLRNLYMRQWSWSSLSHIMTIVWSKTYLLSTGPLGIKTRHDNFHPRKHMQMSPTKCRPFCSYSNMLNPVC